MTPTPKQQALDAITAVLRAVESDRNAILAANNHTTVSPEAELITLISKIVNLAD